MNPPPSKSFRRRIRWLVVPAALLLLLLAYASSYFLVLSLPADWKLPERKPAPATPLHCRFLEVNGEWQLFPDYHGLPDAIFTPMHKLDRLYLRPNKWSGTSPKNQELNFDWLLASFQQKD